MACHVHALKKSMPSRNLLTLWPHFGGVVVQARDRRFCNAGVEFDLKTLKPTYRLMWRSVGASNALAVAEGLGFDPLVIREARKVQYTADMPLRQMESCRMQQHACLHCCAWPSVPPAAQQR